jgi:hypothetical protein
MVTVITENFGTWGRKFPAHIKQSFSPTQQDESAPSVLGGGILRNVL